MQIVNPTPSAMYTGIANAVSQISATEGARSLWRGMTSVILGAGKQIDTKRPVETNRKKVRRTLCTLAHTRSSRTSWVETRALSIIPSLLVRKV